MRRGELYRASPLRGDPKRSRVMVVVSREALVGSSYSTVICAPVYTIRQGIATEVLVGVAEGLKHDSAVRCDELLSVPKTSLTKYVGCLGDAKLAELGQALRVALALEDDG